MSNYVDLEKRRETQRLYREKNREKLREYYNTKFGAEYKRKWRDEKGGQREAERAGRKAYYQRNIGEERRKSREYMRGYYEKNKGQFSEYGKKRHARMREWFRSEFGHLVCTKCGEADFDCIDFHHPVPKGRVNGKRVEPPVTSLLSRRKDVIRRAVESCIVLCANCHRKEHARLRRMQADDRA